MTVLRVFPSVFGECNWNAFLIYFISHLHTSFSRAYHIVWQCCEIFHRFIVTSLAVAALLRSTRRCCCQYQESEPRRASTYGHALPTKKAQCNRRDHVGVGVAFKRFFFFFFYYFTWFSIFSQLLSAASLPFIFNFFFRLASLAGVPQPVLLLLWLLILLLVMCMHHQHARTQTA